VALVVFIVSWILMIGSEFKYWKQRRQLSRVSNSHPGIMTVFYESGFLPSLGLGAGWLPFFLLWVYYRIKGYHLPLFISQDSSSG